MEKNYIKGFATERKFDNGGSIISLTLDLEQLNKLPTNDYGSIKIDVCQKREKDKYGNTHYVVENTWKPKGETEHKLDKEVDDNENSLPF